MNETDHEHRKVLLGGYVLGGLTSAERDEVESHLPGCAECRADLEELETLPDVLELARSDAARPDDDLRERVLATGPHAAAGAPGAGLRLASVAAVVALLAGTVIGASVVRTVEQAPDLVVALTPVDGSGGSGHARLEQRSTGVHVRLSVDDLPALAPDETYQAWLSDGQTRTTAGSFRTVEGRSAELDLSAAGGVGEYQAFGISAVSGTGAAREARDIVLGELPS